LKIFLPFVTVVTIFRCISPAQTASPQTSAASSTQQSSQSSSQEQPPQTNFTSAKGFVLEEGTPVRLRISDYFFG
jgi:hypothetical protein